MAPISNASRLAEFGSGIGTDGAVFQVDNANKRIGIGTTNPQAMLQVGTGVSVYGNVGIVSATEVRADTLRGDGTNITGVVGVGTLNVRTETVTTSGVSTFAGVTKVTDTTETTSTSTGAVIISGGVGIAKSLRVGTELHVGGDVSIGGTLTYEDVTNIDSVGLVTARAGVNVTGGQIQVGAAFSVGNAGVATAAGFVGPLTGAVTGNVTGTASNASGATGDFSIADKIVHTGDTNTALRFPAADTVTVETAGSERVRVSSTGNIGIGTFTTGNTVNIGGAAGLGVRFHNYTSNNSSYITLESGDKLQSNVGGSGYYTWVTGGSEKVRITAAGRLGVGDDSPDTLLHVKSADNVLATFESTDADSLIEFKDNGTSDSILLGALGGDDLMLRCDAGALRFYVANNTEKLRLDSSGRLLLGATSARTAVGAVGDPFFQQEGLGADTGAMSIIRNTDSAAGPYLIFGKTRGTSDGSNTSVQASDTIGSILFAPADGNDINQVCASITAMISGSPGSDDVPGALTFRTTADGGTSPTERVRIMPDGSFGLGTNDPKALLEVNNATGGDVVLLRLRSNPTIGEAQYLAFDGSSNSTRARIGSEIQNGGHGELVFETRDTSTTNLTERLRITDQGRIGIGRTDPQSLFEVAGATPQIRSTDTDAANDYSVFQNSSGSSVYNAVDGGDVGAHIFQANGAEKVRISSSGNLGIGTANPSSQLAIYGADASIRLFDTSGGTSSAYRIMAYNGINYIQSGQEFSSDSSADFVFSTMFGATEHLRIKANGGLDLVGNAQLLERVKITAGKLSDNTNIDLDNGMVHYFTTQESTTCTPNIRIDGSNTLQNAMATGQVCTVTLVTTAAAGGYSAHVTIDGNAVTEEWVGGSAPDAGGDDGLDIYSYTIICIGTGTGDSGFKVIGNKINATN